MARKTQKITISREGRDKGKTFLITEMPAFQAEQWGSRAIIAILNSGNSIDFNIDPREGMLGVVGKVMDMLAGIKPDDAIPLWDQMMTCIQVVSSDDHVRPLLTGEGSEDIEEWLTIMQLKKEAFMLHVDFLKSVVGQILEAIEKASQEFKSTETSPT